MRILSGATPTGRGLHLGNYFGAIRQWIELQNRGEAFYFVASYHALTSVRDAAAMEENMRSVALDYLALGLDPGRATLYRQNDCPEVCELTWILSSVTPIGLLERCHAYKDKIAQGLPADHGLFAYPVLMAADILIVRSDVVPVGQDQKQHVEVTRDIAGKFNQTYGEVFPLPEAHIVETVAKVPGIDGRKMSKSYDNDIRIFEGEKKLRKTILSIVTDSKTVEEPKEPEGNTIFELYKLLAPAERVEDLAARFRAGGLGYGHAKQELFEAFLEFFGPVRRRREELAAKPEEVEEILQEGARRVRPIAEETMDRVRAATGISARIG
ncbi:MAG: tryptophan--tRNA ligase [Planctomycetota bacterium]